MPDALSPIEVGRMAVAWSPATGLRVDVDGVPTVRQSTLYVVKAGWTGVLFGQPDAAWRIDDWRPDGLNRHAAAETRNDDVAVSLRLDVRPDAVTVTLRYRLLRDVPAEIEFAAAYLSAPLLAGGPWKSDTGSGRLPRVAPPTERSQERNRLGGPFSRLAFATPLGELALTWDGDAPRPVCFDARSDAQGWAKAWPVLWLGIGSPAAALSRSDGERTATLTIAVGRPPRRAPAAPPVQVRVRVTATDAAALPPPPRLIPRPKRRRDTKTLFRITPDTEIVAGPDPRPARLLADALHARCGLRPRTVSRPTRGVPTIDLTGAGLPPPDRPEGYALEVTADRVRVAGRDAAGALWGAQTLIQWLHADPRGPLWRGVRIDDWPTLAFRGIHLFHGRDALPFHRKLLDRIAARHKLNALVIQCEQLRWNADPEVAPPWAGTPAQVREEIAAARERGISVTPLVQGYGHMEWLFQKERNRAFAEDPETPYALNATDPDALAYLERFVAEADTLFDAGAVHVGMDEVTMRGRFPFRSAPKSFPELFVAVARHWHAFLAARGTRTWMWADMLLHPSEVAPSFGTAPSADAAKAVRAGLPRDIVLFDWQYEPRPSYPSLALLRREGFTKVVATSWFNPAGIRAFAKAAAQAGAWGGLQSTWCGYESKESVLETPERRQFEAMLAAAEHFWNGGETEVDGDIGERFAGAWAEPSPTRLAARAGRLLRLSAPRAALDPALRPVRRLSDRLRAGDGTLFAPGTPLALTDRLGPGGLPAAARIDLPGGGGDLRLLLCATRRLPAGGPVGSVVLEGPGGTRTLPLVYGRNIAAPDDPAACPEAPVAWEGMSAAGTALRLRCLTVPLRDARVLYLRVAHPATAPVLYALTGVR